MLIQSVTEIKADAALAGGPDLGQDLHVVVHDAVRSGRSHMRDDVAGAQHVEQDGQRGIGIADVNHHRQAGSLGGFDGPAEDFLILVAGDELRQARFHADDPIAIHLNGGDGFSDVGVIEVIDELGNAAGKVPQAADVEHDAHTIVRRDGELIDQHLDVVGPAGARVHHGGDPGRKELGRRKFGVAGMDMNVDQTGDDQPIRRIENLGIAGIKVRRYRGNRVAGDTDVHHLVDVVGGVDHPSTANDQVKGGFGCRV